MDTVKAFNAELYSLYEAKPPISKAKMTAITKGAIKAVKFYKHVVQSVEKFLQKCRVEYKIPGLYVIDSIVRQSRHQFGADKDVFAGRFSKNINITFYFIYQCSNEEKSKVIRVLNLWQKNSIFPPEVIQPLFDMADSSHPKYKEVSQFITSKGGQGSVGGSRSAGVINLEKESSSSNQGASRDVLYAGFDDSSNDNSKGQLLMGNLPPVNSSEMSLATRLQHLQHLFNPEAGPQAAPPPAAAAAAPKAANASDTGQIRFNKNLLDFDYGEEDEEPAAQVDRSRELQLQQQHQQQHQQSKPAESLGNLLTNPEILRHLQSLQQQIQQPGLNMGLFGPAAAAAAAMGVLAANDKMQQPGFPSIDLSQPPPGFPMLPMGMGLPPVSVGGAQMFPLQGPQQQQQLPFQQADRREDGFGALQSNSSVDGGMNIDEENVRSRDKDRKRSSRSRSRSASRGRSQRNRHRKSSRSRSRSRERERRRRPSRSRSRSPHGRRRRSRSREREVRERERLEREKERERKRKGLPTVKKDHLSVCSTTLWVGHLSKLVQQEELSDTFGQYGDIVSIDLIPPRGCAFVCMHRRQDAYRALNKLAGHKLQGKAITLAWAPGKGVKSKEWKDYWELEEGVSYIPWGKINSATDLESLEDGGSLDEETLPPWLQKNGTFQEVAVGAQPGFIPIPEATSVVSTAGPSTPETATLPGDPLSSGASAPATISLSGNSLSGAPTTLPPNLPTYGMANIHPPLGLIPGGGMAPGMPLGMPPGLQLPPPGMQGLLVPPNAQMHNLLNQQLLAGLGQANSGVAPIPLQQLMNQGPNLTGEAIAAMNRSGSFPFRAVPPSSGPPVESHNETSGGGDDMDLEDADEHEPQSYPGKDARDEEMAARERAWENDDDDDEAANLPPPNPEIKANLPSLLERLRSLAHNDSGAPSPQKFPGDDRNGPMHEVERGMEPGGPVMGPRPMDGVPRFALSPNLASNLRGAPLTASGDIGVRLLRPGVRPNEQFGPPRMVDDPFAPHPMMGGPPGSSFGPPGGFPGLRGPPPPPPGPGVTPPRMGLPGPRGVMMFENRGPRPNFRPRPEGPDFGPEGEQRRQSWEEPWWRDREEDRFRGDGPEWERDRNFPDRDRGQWNRDDRSGPMDNRRGRDWNRKPMRNDRDRGSGGRDRFARDRDHNRRPVPSPRNGERDRDRDRRGDRRGGGRWGPAPAAAGGAGGRRRTPPPGFDSREPLNRDERAPDDTMTNPPEDINSQPPVAVQPPSPPAHFQPDSGEAERENLTLQNEDCARSSPPPPPPPLPAGGDSQTAIDNSNSDIIADN